MAAREIEVKVALQVHVFVLRDPFELQVWDLDLGM